MKKNYPIKYAVMAIKEENNWAKISGNLGNGYGDVAYIVSKVYLLGSNTLYFNDGTSKNEYNVVFPYKSPADLEDRRGPKYGINSFYVDYDTVDFVFDNYNDANEYAGKLNDRLRKIICKSMIATGIDLNIQQEQSNILFSDRLEEYQKFEDLILTLSDDMVITPSLSSNNIEGLERILGRKLTPEEAVEVLKLYDGKSYIVDAKVNSRDYCKKMTIK